MDAYSSIREYFDPVNNDSLVDAILCETSGPTRDHTLDGNGIFILICLGGRSETRFTPLLSNARAMLSKANLSKLFGVLENIFVTENGREDEYVVYDWFGAPRGKYPTSFCVRHGWDPSRINLTILQVNLVDEDVALWDYDGEYKFLHTLLNQFTHTTQSVYTHYSLSKILVTAIRGSSTVRSTLELKVLRVFVGNACHDDKGPELTAPDGAGASDGGHENLGQLRTHLNIYVLEFRVHHSLSPMPLLRR
ncbi:hypothetical protein DFH09DRAFT_1086117 [Mycena vulgaris]|nr:hypothetical protein DFH09DRAFT_1086117 [Mycena vulgaris]